MTESSHVDADLEWQPPRLPWDWDPPVIDGLSPQVELAAACHYLHEIGYDEMLFGHITWEQPDGTYLTNGFETTFDCMTAANVVAIDDNCRKVSDNRGSPSAGLDLHMSLRHYLPRKQSTCVIHAHGKYGIRWAVRKEAPRIYDLGSAWLPDDVHVTKDESQLWLSKHDALAIGESGWGLLARHGALSVATTLQDALYKLTILEHRSHQAWVFDHVDGAAPMDPSVAAKFPTFRGPQYTTLWWDAMLRRIITLNPQVMSS
jgi:ribulose-5-phosphate 4-epimerase/fuculose-1-phosphate aldolase